MTQTLINIKTAAKRRIPARLALYLLSSITVTLLAGSSAPVPLYAVYQAHWHFSPITTTVIFGIYAFAVLSSLLVFGSLSDFVGRRPVLLVAIAAQLVTMTIFTTAHTVTDLILARIIQGLSTGAATGAIGAGMLDIDKARGTSLNAISPVIGTASGALGAGLLVQFLPAPTHLVYLVLIGLFIAQALGIYFARETSPRSQGALSSLKIEFNLPSNVRRSVLLAAPALVASWSLIGFYSALIPSIVREFTGSSSHVLGGLGLFVVAASGAITVPLTRNRTARIQMSYGTLALAVGIGLVEIAIIQNSIGLLFTGSAIAGTGFGAAFQGAVRTVVPLALPNERAGVLSVVYVISYLAMGLPAIVAGYFVVHGGGLLPTARYYGLFAITLSTLAFIGINLEKRMNKPTPIEVVEDMTELRAS